MFFSIALNLFLALTPDAAVDLQSSRIVWITFVDNPTPVGVWPKLAMKWTVICLDSLFYNYFVGNDKWFILWKKILSLILVRLHAVQSHNFFWYSMWKSDKIYNSLNNSTLLISIEIIQCIIYIYIEILYTCIGFGIYRCYIYSIIYFIKIV